MPSMNLRQAIMQSRGQTLAELDEQRLQQQQLNAIPR